MRQNVGDRGWGGTPSDHIDIRFEDVGTAGHAGFACFPNVFDEIRETIRKLVQIPRIKASSALGIANTIWNPSFYQWFSIGSQCITLLFWKSPQRIRKEL